MKKWIFWIGFVLLLADLISYMREIRVYFTTFGIVLLIASLLLIAASQFVKGK